MNEQTYQRVLNKISFKLANSEMVSAQFEALYEEAQEQCKQANDLLAKFNKVLDSDPALKELFDETAQKLEEQKD
ncbi:hypothetical protein Javan377_0005 [Streptococcus phage Javan377]|uniref:Uncharacterized protein n=1 Tax=Streptococcus parasanguinis F0449 TaxID=1095733 RepID=I2NHL3_STRPA|nr:hypothetical protein [Streptococcus parasanguinis]EIG25324.1 hypothetical protein HMPREF9971_0050 [Streptococcus parasanguinis F0449]QBX17754.1 hypothetical protein Javan377_0005 [Streptococcus phage Javan377]QBX17802.1 hypothetical protein Javan381_0005 [Streptococcus phage Javan381]QBX27292.1 hypothetical protein Javan380_0005 [Streptococcus phage Javan380]